MAANRVPIDSFGEFIHQGTMLAIARDSKQLLCVVSQVIGTAGNVRALFYSELNGKIIKKQAVVTGDELKESAVIVTKQNMSSAVGVWDAAMKHSDQLRTIGSRGAING